MRIRHALALVVSAALLLATPVLADSAQQLIEEGTREYDEGNYLASAHALERAYAIVQAPRLLFNIGRAYEKAGDRKAAIDVYTRYLRSGDTEQDLVQRVGDAIERLRALEAHDAAAARSAAAAEPKPPPAASGSSAPAAPPPKDSGSSTLRTVGIVTGAAGASIVLGSVLVDAIYLNGLIDDFHDSARKGDGKASDLKGRVDTTQTLLIVTYVSGAVLTAGGVGAFLLSMRRKSAPASDRAPSPAGPTAWVSPTGAGAGWQGRW